MKRIFYIFYNKKSLANDFLEYPQIFREGVKRVDILNLGMKTLTSVGQKIHDPCFHKKYMEAWVMTFVAHFTTDAIEVNLTLQSSPAYIC